MLSESIHRACRALNHGGIIAYPTESIYGLGCSPSDQEAVNRLLQLKQRPHSKGFIIIASTLCQCEHWLSALSPEQIERMAKKRDRPTTWIVPASKLAPSWLMGEYESIALRLTKHPIARALCQAYGNAIISTSANLHQHPPCKTPTQLKQHFPQGIDYILEGPLGEQNKTSEIRDLLTNAVLRA